MSTVRIVIVNYRTADLVLDCLRSLAAEVRGLGNCRVVVVDNCSGDDSVGRIRGALEAEGWGGWAELLPLEQNRGFAAGNNAALRRLLAGAQAPDYLWLLNPDTVVRPGGLRALVEFMESHPEAGIAGSRLEDPDATPQRSAFRFPGVASELERGMRLGLLSKLLRHYLVAPPVEVGPHPADWVSGASMLVRREVFESVGLLDEGYFLYFEETDFCLRARRVGWRCWYVPASRVVHLVGQSSGIKDGSRTARRIPVYWLESRRRYFGKSHGALYRFATDVAWALGFACWRLRRRLQRKPDQDPPGLLWDFLRFNFTPAGLT
jgi:N-acetylglucosaminyl-diphospho-decaprenol L-rhamnosyltransferase